MSSSQTASALSTILQQPQRPQQETFELVHRPTQSLADEGNDDPSEDVTSDDVDYSFIVVQQSFQTLRRLKLKKFNREPDIEDVDQHFNNDQTVKPQLRNLDKSGGEDISFMHFLIKAPARLQERMPLIQWAMKTYPDQYLRGIDGDKTSILQILHTKSKTSNDALLKFVSAYPLEVANILRKTKDGGKLLSVIIPMVRTLNAPEFLTFFDPSPENLKPNPNTRNKNSPPEVDNMEFVPVANDVSVRDGRDVSYEEMGEVILLHWPKKTTTASGQASTRNRKQIHPERARYKDEKGQTPLHLASTYCDCDESQRKAQFNLVQKFLAWCPTAIENMDNDGRSAYLHRVASSGKPSLINQGDEGDEIAFLLKDNIMHLDDRDLVLTLLYGWPINAQPPSQRPDSAMREREIHLDLRELQNSESQRNLIRFIKNLNFEDILQYVRIPQHPFSSPDLTNDQIKPEKKTSGRRDFEEIFKVLHDKKVRKILKLVVDDDEDCLHEDEVIESLSRFKIEDFQWMKMDLSVMVLRHAVPDAQNVHLFSSGNHSVLRDWSSSEGLCQMTKLESVSVKIYRKTESQTKTESYARDFIERLVNHSPHIRSIEVAIEPRKNKSQEDWTNTGFLVSTNKWIQTMRDFAKFLGNVRDKMKLKGDAVQVAILDDGIDWPFAHERQCRGRSFYADKRNDFNGQNVWYSSSTGHGTLMAELVRMICPNVSFLIARLDQTGLENNTFQPTPESAAKAIRWAIQMGAHIISMSWTIPGDYPELTNAVDEARTAGILLFGSASDQGATSSVKPYMAKLSGEKNPVICIGGAREAGYGDDRALLEGEFFFPGQINGLTDSLPSLKSKFSNSIGSSVATALAVGFTALIKVLVNMLPEYESYREQLQDPNNIRLIFQNLLSKSDMNKLAEQRTAVIIPIEKYIKLKRLRNSLKGVSENDIAERSNRVLKDILNRLLRALININEDRKFEDSGSEDNDDSD
ncbi:hypothetical protein H0G86_009949 [Trichoderma simmonsii]|uniref:Peptidase S8/S53 domain-containing protein n=1 Tax=Trichoderma simmonsii TaxID=1491479 RepID=A0A8G0LLB8_9HYPO|nr:hypothetical protein H0G86_009949 [Trichoderma simmonsii]